MGGVVLQEDGGGGVPLGSGLFDDVPVGHWADVPVGWAVSNGVMEGVGGGRFDLGGVVPRWQIVSVLFRAFLLAGGVSRIVVVGLGSGSFVDVPVGHVADGAIGWAVASGITLGVGGGRFDPDGSVTRAQIVTFLFRLSGLLGGPVDGGGLGSEVFVDVPVGHWADEEVGWAVAGGVTVGVGWGRFDLEGVVSRAQIVTFLFRVVGLVEESTVEVSVEAVDLAHIDSGEVVVGLGVEDPVGVGGVLEGAAGVTGLAVAVDASGDLQGLSLVLKVDGPAEVRVDYRTTAAALVYMTPGLASSNPLLTFTTLWVLSELPEFGVLVGQLEADAARYGRSYLVDLSPETREALADAVEALVGGLLGSGSGDSSFGLGGFGVGDVGLSAGGSGVGGAVQDWKGSCVGLECLVLLVRTNPCTDEQEESEWDQLVGDAFGFWDPTGSRIGHNDGVCLQEEGGVVFGKNHGWAAVAAAVVDREDGRLGFDDSYLFISSRYLDIPDVFDLAEQILKTGFCELWGGIKSLFGGDKDCPHREQWEKLLDVVKGDEVAFPLALLNETDAPLSRFAVVKHGWGGPNPFESSEMFVEEELRDLERVALVYQSAHLAVPLISIIADKATAELGGAVSGWVTKLAKRRADRLGTVIGAIKGLKTRVDISAKVKAGVNATTGGHSTLTHWVTTFILALFDSIFDETVSEIQDSAIRKVYSEVNDVVDGDLTRLDTSASEPNPLLEDSASFEKNIYGVVSDTVWAIARIALEVVAEQSVPVIGQISAAVNGVNSVGTIAMAVENRGFDTLGFYAAGQEDPALTGLEDPALQRCIAEFSITDMALGHVFGERREDMVVVGPQGIKRYQQNGVGGFADPGDILTCDLKRVDQVVVGDINGDGHDDIIVTNNVTRIVSDPKPDATYTAIREVVAFRGNLLSAGEFEQATFTFRYSPAETLKTLNNNGAIGIAIGDLNGDRKEDLVLGGGGAVELYSDTTKTWTTVSSGLGKGSTSIAIGDVNGDGHNDIAAIEPNQLWVILSTGNGNFETPLPLGHTPNTTENLQIAVADLNGDNLADIVTADQDRTTIHISNPAFFNNPTNNYQPPPLHLTTPGNPYDITIGNIAGDLHPDIITIRRKPDTLQVLQSHNQNNQQGLCATQSTPLPNGTAVAIANHIASLLFNTTNAIITTNATTYHPPTIERGRICSSEQILPLPTIDNTGTELEQRTTTRPPTQYTAVAAGWYQSCALDTQGMITCWGSDFYRPQGQFTTIAAGWFTSCALDTEGKITCWGGLPTQNNVLRKLGQPQGQYTALAIGRYHACALDLTGLISCWGDNQFGEGIAPQGQYTAITAGEYHSCALDDQGSIRCWGGNDKGQSTPPQGQYIAIASGWSHSCALNKEGNVTCWGDNTYGYIDPPQGRYSAIAAGDSHSCALDAEGNITCWGPNYDGRSTPPQGQYTNIALGRDYACSVDTEGKIICWPGGSDTASPPQGQYRAITAAWTYTCALNGQGKISCWGSSPGPIPSEGQYSAVAAGEQHLCAIDSQGHIVCWGRNDYGQATPPEGQYKAIAAGIGYSCGLSTRGEIACWGRNSYGEAAPPKGQYASIEVGVYHSCAINTDGIVACWGRNNYGEATPPQGRYSAISVGRSHSCALEAEGEIVCWGSHDLGEIPGRYINIALSDHSLCALNPEGKIACWGNINYGEATPPQGRYTAITGGKEHYCALDTQGESTCWGRWWPSQTTAPEGDYTDIASSGSHLCALNPEEKIACWGNNNHGQATPPQGRYTTISVGNWHSCALDAAGEITCWGDNRSGQATPPQGQFNALVSGSLHSCALDAAGEIICWGDNRSGQASPPQGLYTAVAAGPSHSCALDAQGEIACWGEYTYFGEGTSPQGQFTAITAGWRHSCALDAQGEITCWGASYTSQSTPPQGTYTAIATGQDHSCALDAQGRITCWGDNQSGAATPPQGEYTSITAGPLHTCALNTEGKIICWGVPPQLSIPSGIRK